MRAIGGFFELELDSRSEYHSKAIKLNSGRNALRFILSVKNFKRVYIPHFICEVLPQTLKESGIDFTFYNINKDLEPEFEYDRIGKHEAFLYINYFGLKDNFIDSLRKKILGLIIDNAQSFFSLPVNGVDTFYSPRKFFGVPDGAYLYTNTAVDIALNESVSSNRVEHLVKRIDDSAESAFPIFRQSELSLHHLQISRMSLLTERILSSIDYESAAQIRRENFMYLDNALGELNQLKLPLEENCVPMVYPFYGKTTGLREKLKANKIYTAMYWPNVLESANESSIEYDFTLNIIHLPIDQRYGKAEMDFIITIVKNG
jgi:hypothetical protein